MEETQIVENFAILLYSRTYYTLFLYILNSYNQNVISKHVIKTSDFVTINLGMPLSEVQMMVFKSEYSMQILNEFKFELEDFNTASTVEQKSNYVKLKKRFPQYSLLLQIFYQSKSPINSSDDLDRYDEKEAMRLTAEENKKQKLNEIKAMAKANLVLLGMKIINGLCRRKKKCKTVIPSEGSLDRRMNRKNTKYRTVFVDDINFHHFKRWNYSQTNLYKYAEVLSSKDISKDVSIQNYCDQDSNLKDKPNKNYKREFPRKKNNQYLNMERKASQNSAYVKKLKTGKKITLEDDILSIKDLSYDKNDYRRRQVSSIHTKKSIDEKHDLVKPIKRINILPQKKDYCCTLDHSRVDKANDDFGAGNHPISNFFGYKSSSRNLIIRRLKNLCQYRTEYKIQIKKVASPKLKLHFTLYKYAGKEINDKSIKNKGKIYRYYKNLRRKTYVTNRIYGSHEFFYQNLYNKTMNSLERQKYIINFVQSECNTNDFLPYSNMSMALVKSHKMLYYVRITNMSTETHYTIYNTKGYGKLKKITSQGQLYRVYKTYVDKNNKRKLRS